MIGRIVQALTALLLCGAIEAAELKLAPGTGSGTAVVKITVDAAGNQTVTVDLSQPVTITSWNAGPTPPPPPPPPPPPGPVLTERAKAVKSAAEKVNDPKRQDNAHMLAELYRQIAILVGDSARGYNKIMLAVSTGTDMVLKDDATKAAWAPVRAVITAEANNLARAGATDAEFAKYLQECATGFDASAPNKTGISPEFWKFLVEVVIPYLLKMLLMSG